MCSYTAHERFAEQAMCVYMAHTLVYTLTSCMPLGTRFTLKLTVNLDSGGAST